MTNVSNISFDISMDAFQASQINNTQTLSSEKIRGMMGEILDQMRLDDPGWDDFVSEHYPELHAHYTEMGYHSGFGLFARLNLEPGFDLIKEIIIESLLS